MSYSGYEYYHKPGYFLQDGVWKRIPLDRDEERQKDYECLVFGAVFSAGLIYLSLFTWQAHQNGIAMGI